MDSRLGFVERNIRKNKKSAQIPLYLINIYIFALFIVEYLGYYIFKIRLNSDFPSLLRLGIIHAPLGMKLFYIFAGPIYILITDYLKVK